MMRKLVAIPLITVTMIGGVVFYMATRKPKKADKSNGADELAQLKQLQAQFKTDFPEHLKADTLALSGTYHWTFFLGPVKQVSTHLFVADNENNHNSIDYQMRGKAHSTDYRMHRLSYDASQKKWIGVADGVVYVLFFKDITTNAITLYKHKCENGLAEAVRFSRPDDDSTADHGWNIYTREGVTEAHDDLPLSGMYQDKNNQQIILNDDSITWQGNTYAKLTHHTGEKRWVGQLGDVYLVMFYELPDGHDAKQEQPLKLSLQTLTNIEKAYKVKHDEQRFSEFTT